VTRTFVADALHLAPWRSERRYRHDCYGSLRYGWMRIAVDARALGARPTGVGRYLEGLFTAWTALFPADELLLLSPPPGHHPDALRGRAEVRTQCPRVPGTLWLQTLAPFLARRGGADLFFGPLGILPIRAELTGVATIHDLTPLLHPEWHDMKNRLGFSLLAPTVRGARGIIAVSEATRRDLVALHPEAAARCVVVPNGCAPTEPAEPSGNGHARSSGRPYVLYLGTLEPRKNLERLVLAMESIWDRRPDFPDLVLAGGHGWGLRGFAARLSASRHAKRIDPIGYVAEKDVPGLLRGARLLAYPSLYEGFGLPALEAMAHGTVVVGSSSSSLPEVIGDAGLLPDPYDVGRIAAALLKAQYDEPWRRAARARGLERARSFTWTAAAEKTRTVFESALS
jgi:glycosyltransferase involved in cell wall biosynthesis